MDFFKKVFFYLAACLFVNMVSIHSVYFSKLYLTGAVYSLDGSDSLKETMQTGVSYPHEVREPWWLQNSDLKLNDKNQVFRNRLYLVGFFFVRCNSTVLEAPQTRFYPVSWVS